MIAIECFESRVQQEHECRIRDHVLGLQNECRDHVGSGEMKQHESRVVRTTARHIEAACDQRLQQSVQNGAGLEDNLTSEALEETTVMRQNSTSRSLPCKNYSKTHDVGKPSI